MNPSKCEMARLRYCRKSKLGYCNADEVDLEGCPYLEAICEIAKLAIKEIKEVEDINK